MNFQSRLAQIACFIGIVLITALVYFQSLWYGFLFDDLPNIVKSFDIRHGTVSDFFCAHSRWISSSLNAGYYKIAEFQPFIYRLGNLIIHLTNGSLIYAILSLALKRLPKEMFANTHSGLIALLSTGLFLLHPVATQTVCYVIQGQLEGLSALAVLAMCLLFLRYTKTESVLVCAGYVVAILMLAFLSAGTKEIAIVSPALLLLLDWFFVSQGNWRELRSRWFFYVLLVIVVVSSFCFLLKPDYFLSIIGFNLQRTFNSGNALSGATGSSVTPWQFLISQFKVLLHYVCIYLVPFGISVDYDYQLAEGFWTPEAFVPFCVLALFGLVVVWRLWRDKIDLIAFGFLWFFVCMAPRASIIPSSELVADYKTYLASVGILFVLALAYAHLITWFVQKYDKRRLIIPLSFAVLLPYAILSYYRTRVWRSMESLWANIIAHTPEKPRSHNNYGIALLDSDRVVEAIKHFEKAIELDGMYSDPWNNLAVAYSKLNNRKAAIEAFKQVLIRNPYHAEGYNNLATLLIADEDFTMAESALRHALQLRPHFGKALYNLGRIRAAQHKLPEAQQLFRLACTQADFDSDICFEKWGAMSLALNDFEQAIEAYKLALKRNPKALDYAIGLAQAYRGEGDYANAERLLRELYGRAPGNPNVVLALAEVYTKTKRYVPALELYRKIEPFARQFPMMYMRMAECAYKQQDYPLTIRYIERFLSNNPPDDIAKRAELVLQALDSKNYGAEALRWFNT